MFKSMPKKEYLDHLQARVRQNRQIVQSVFMPLDDQQRGWQPVPGEWSIDQCFEHLILTYEGFLPGVLPSLEKPQRPNFDGLFRPSWQARLLMDRLWDPNKKFNTKNQFKPAQRFIPDVLQRFLQQLEHLQAMIEQARSADLQDKSWWHKSALIRFNLGDHLLAFVGHDELHIEQARRAHEAYVQMEKALPV